MYFNETNSQFSYFVNIYIFGNELKLGFKEQPSWIFCFQYCIVDIFKICLYKDYEILFYKITNKYIRLVE
jgi:hypothetical protein